MEDSDVKPETDALSDAVIQTGEPGGGQPCAPVVEQLLTFKQAADLLGVTDRTVWTLVNDGRLPAVRFGRTVRIDPGDLRAFIERAKGRPTDDGK